MVNKKRNSKKTVGENQPRKSSPSFGIRKNIFGFISVNKDYIAIALLVILAIISLFIFKPQQASSAVDLKVLEERLVNLEKGVSQLTDKTNELSDALSKINSANVSQSQITRQGQVLGVKKVSDSQSTQKLEPTSGKININSANLSQLDSLSGIGPTYAQRIIDYRSSNGGFKSIEEIKNVKGIGDKTFEKFKDKITI